MSQIEGENIKDVEFVGEPCNRRDALQRLGIGMSALTGAALFGADPFSVGVEGKGVGDHSFGALGGFVDNGTLYLPSGVSLQIGQYGNPIVAPGIFHGATLENLDPSIVDHGDLRKAVGLKEDASIPEALEGMRIYKALIRAEGQQGYTEYDLSQRWQSPPKIEVGVDGSLEITQGGNQIVTKSDGFHLQLAYHPDRNRVDSGGLIGVFEQGPPPTASQPIGFSEVDIAALPVAATTDGWQGVAASQAQLLNVLSSTDGMLAQGAEFIRNGPNLWRYAFEERGDAAVVFQVECKRHGDRPDSDWDKMGDKIYYQLVTEANGTVIGPEPDLGKTMNMRHLNPTGENLHVTGVILYSDRGGEMHTERTSLTKLQVDGGKVKIQGSQMIHEQGGEVNAYQIVELRKKPGFSQTTADLYAVRTDQNGLKALPVDPVVTTIGSFDLVQAYRNSKKLLPEILT